MHLAHLALTDVRSFRHLAIDLEPGIYVIAGENAAGKTNLLESVAMLATTRGVRSGPDLDLIAWQALAEDPLPAARLQDRGEPLQVRGLAVLAHGAEHLALRRLRRCG